MSADFVVGIDVAGRKRGYQCAILNDGQSEIQRIFEAQEPQEILKVIKERSGTCLQIAIDAPPRAHIDVEANEKRDGKTRLAERQLNNKGFNVQWTPRDESQTDHAKWMENGERLWEKLSKKYEEQLIETFPTASVPGLKNTDVTFPLSLFTDKNQRREAKDYFDAAICAVVAREAEDDDSNQVRTFGKVNAEDKYDDDHDDVLGLIHVLEPDRG